MFFEWLSWGPAVCPFAQVDDWKVTTGHLGRTFFGGTGFWTIFIKLVFVDFLWWLLTFLDFDFYFYFIFLIFPFPSVRWWNPSGQCVSKTWWTIYDFLVLKIEKYFGLLTDVKKSLRNVKHRSEILSTRSTSLDNQKYIFLLIYSRTVKKWNKNEKKVFFS